jgi:predicted nuclease with TOPRIM domain
MNHKNLQKPATKQDLEEAIAQIGTAVIKSLENVATKDDLKQCATKDDLKQCATKNDLKNLEERLDKRIDVVDVRLDGVDKRLERLENNVEEVKVDVKVIKRRLGALETDVVRKTEFRAFQKTFS